jgi:hypothetical protein
VATPSPDGRRYITFSVQAWWDESTSRIHISSNDPDLPGGLHTNLKPGTAAERVVKAALTTHGKPAS